MIKLIHKVVIGVGIFCMVVLVGNEIKDWVKELFWHKAEVTEKLQDDQKRSLTIEKGKLTFKKKDKEGNTITKDKYIPPEGRVFVVEKNNGEIEMDVKNKGLCISPFLGTVLNNHFEPGLSGGIKFAYWGRYGLNIGASNNELYGAVSRHVAYFQNLQIMAGYGVRFKEIGGTALIGIMVNW